MKNLNEKQAVSLQVAENLTVTILPNSKHEFLMTSREVAHGYDATLYAVRKSLLRHGSELIEGKHFVKGIDILSTPEKVQPHQVLWTKRGVVRLGFFIKSQQAKLFRDWAEDLIIKVEEKCFNNSPTKQLPIKRKHNRLTQDRLVDIMADVCMINDDQLRQSLVSKLLNQ